MSYHQRHVAQDLTGLHRMRHRKVEACDKEQNKEGEKEATSRYEEAFRRARFRGSSWSCIACQLEVPSTGTSPQYCVRICMVHDSIATDPRPRVKVP